MPHLWLSHAFSLEDPATMTIFCLPRLSNSLSYTYGTDEARTNGTKF